MDTEKFERWESQKVEQTRREYKQLINQIVSALDKKDLEEELNAKKEHEEECDCKHDPSKYKYCYNCGTKLVK